MKKICLIAGLLFLASCGNTEVQETKTDEAPAAPKTTIEDTVEIENDDIGDDSEGEIEEDDLDDVSAEINSEIEVIETAQEDTSKTVILDAAYTNPRGPVDMTVTYSTDSDGIITALNVSATTYDVSEFNNEVQTLIGSTLEDAAEYKSGSSLTGYAFTQAVKAEIN